MDFPDEHYVKLFTRDTVTWKSWPWQARVLFPLLLRVVDHAGILCVGTREPARSVALMVDVPAEEIVRAGLDALLGDGTVELINGNIIITKFVEAQESRKTDAQSKRDQRERAKAKARATQVLNRTEAAVQTVSDAVLPSPPPPPSSAQPSPSSAQPSPPPPPSPPPSPRDDDSKGAVVVAAKGIGVGDLKPEQRELWRRIQAARMNYDLAPELVPPSGFPAWADEIHNTTVDRRQIDHALALYLRDKHFEDRRWPTAVFITPGVWRQRLPAPPSEVDLSQPPPRRST